MLSFLQFFESFGDADGKKGQQNIGGQSCKNAGCKQSGQGGASAEKPCGKKEIVQTSAKIDAEESAKCRKKKPAESSFRREDGGYKSCGNKAEQIAKGRLQKITDAASAGKNRKSGKTEQKIDERRKCGIFFVQKQSAKQYRWGLQSDGDIRKRNPNPCTNDRQSGK